MAALQGIDRFAFAAAPTIVIVERDALMWELLAEWLKAERYEVYRWDGMEPAPALDPAMAVVDVCWPRHAEISSLRRVRAAFPGVPIAVISGRFSSGTRGAGTAAHRLGVHQAIPKPCHRAQLVAAVREIVGSPRP
ncbi:MAG: response regulator [Burkholderiales bacterium]|nr:response regulator [Burkholderiales bacterium]